MICGSTSALHFIQICAGRPSPGVVDLVGDIAQQRFLERDRRNRHLLEAVRLGIAGDEIENARDVASDRRIGGEKRNVGIDAGGHRMIIAGAEMTVIDQRAALAPHHHRELGVGLELDEAIDDLRARALEIPRPADVGLFVEARLEFDERGDRLAGLRRFDEGSDDRAVGRGAIERLLDRDDVGIVRRLVEELDDDVERFVRMMDDEIFLPDRGEAIAADAP